jgi:adenylosuccinate lyase
MQAAGHAEASRWLHYGLTSNDVVDTAQALQIRQACGILLAGLERCGRAEAARLRIQAHRADRPHPRRARRADHLRAEAGHLVRRSGAQSGAAAAAAEDLRVGKISGAVGTFAHIGPEAEERICARLGLKPAPVASQVIQRDRHAAFVATLALATALCEKIALEVRHLQRTEVREAEEYFARGQKGSSAMPHKRNPVTCEQICGLARVVRANVQAAFEDVALWHERDISHSSVERGDPARFHHPRRLSARKDHELVDKLLVYPERMRRNLEMTRGWSSPGSCCSIWRPPGCCASRRTASCSHAMRAWEEESDFRAAIEADPEIRAVLTPQQIAESFSLERQLRNVAAPCRIALGETRRLAGENACPTLSDALRGVWGRRFRLPTEVSQFGVGRSAWSITMTSSGPLAGISFNPTLSSAPCRRQKSSAGLARVSCAAERPGSM